MIAPCLTDGKIEAALINPTVICARLNNAVTKISHLLYTIKKQIKKLGVANLKIVTKEFHNN